MMFGTRESFGYFECAQCGTLQIEEVPDLRRHYPKDYLSLGNAEDVPLAHTLRRRIVARSVGKYLLSGRGILGRMVLQIKPWFATQFPRSFHDLPGRVTLDSRILDFGFGTGRLPQTLHYLGFRRLLGADAFIDSDIRYSSGVEIKKGSLADLEPAFDLVMLNHSFEHLPDPALALAEIQRLLSPSGVALIRMPVVNAAWKKYGPDWVQLDAPRHLFLFSESGFTEFAENHGFVVEKVVYDSEAMQFWGSEQYKLDIPLNDPRTHNYPNIGTVFSIEQIREWERASELLNQKGQGDQAAFYLKKI
ncbi:MAG: class I SAM-dependent methyltransferase [Acidobacteria bacterium]|nr:class I SAM-dependent methyltransferase [Acidobacteriota bacterium]